ncbi:hypothetical protein MASR1M31_16240 [Porphyromonadaceae bacterium]
MDALKVQLVEKLMTLTNGKTSQGVKDYLGVEVVPKGARFTHKVLLELDFAYILYFFWTTDTHKNEMISAVIVNYLKKYRELDAELKRRKFDVSIGDELPTGIVQLAKVYIAKKRKICVGDKMAGRHETKSISRCSSRKTCRFY